MDKLYIINSLATLEKIKKGQKIAVYHDRISIVEHPYRIVRWLSGNSNHLTHVHLTEIINNAISLEVPISLNIVPALEQLKLTYRRHDKFVKGMTVLQNNIIELNKDNYVINLLKLLVIQTNQGKVMSARH